MRASRSSSAADDVASAVAGEFVLLALVVILLLVYLVFQAGWLVVRVTQQHPTHRVLRIAWGGCVGGWVLVGLVAALGAGTSVLDACLILAVLTTVGLVLVAKLIELDATDLVQTQRTKDLLIQDVLSRPWWEAA